MWRASLPALARAVAPAEWHCCTPAYPVFARCVSAGGLGLALPPQQQQQAFHQAAAAAAAGAGPPSDASPAPAPAPTIFALSSGQGRSAVAVIRLSGPGTDAALSALLPAHRPLPPPRTLSLATLRHPHSREALDRGLVARFPGPASFTGEDCAELHVHGGPAVVRAVLDALGLLPWARPAEAGEFSRRAFQAGKLDLTEVEGLADLLHAETEAQRRQALAQSGGAVRRAYEGWRATLLKCLARVEAVIDFGEDEGIADEVAAGVVPLVAQLRAKLEAHLAVGDAGELVREGVRVAIVGPPNAGKSSLLNTLAGRDAAIVSPIPGTTRDTVEVALDLGGYKVLVTDSAGLRDTADPIEAEGVRRAQAAVQRAHVVLLLRDAAAMSVNAEEQQGAQQGAQQGVGGAAGSGPEVLASSSSGVDFGGPIDSGGSRLAVAAACTQQRQPETAAPEQQQQQQQHQQHQQHQRKPVEWGAGELQQLAAALSAKPSGCVVEAYNKLDALKGSSREAFVRSLDSLRGLMPPNTPSTPQQVDGQALPQHPAVQAPAQHSAQPPVGISVATGEGLEQLLAQLQAAVAAAVRAGGDPTSAALVARARHRHHLSQCVRALERYAAAPLQVEIAAEELRAAAKALGRVTGAIDTESVLDSVFSEFCIGK